MPGVWHNRMEELFPEEMREVKFFCSSNKSNTCRRADICLSNERTCEIQHSYISEHGIRERINDWKKFGKEIIWLVDGNEGIQLEQLSSGNNLMIFNTRWKYKSFINNYEFILLEISGKIFKIELNKIINGMIELKEYKSIQDTIEYLKTKPKDIWKFWNDDNVIKSTLSVYQQGAGNGKTYGIWKSITENIDRNVFIIVTKQHSAKNVIYEELIDQKLRFHESEGKDAYHIKYIENDCEFNTEKHYVINYEHKETGRECNVIIGTIDSFCFNLSNSNAKGSDYFKGIINNITENGPSKLRNGYMSFGGQFINIGKKTDIWIDEVQDLPENYLHAMLKLMYETQCYMNVVGDKLQSLEFSNNFLTEIDEELPNIKVVIKEPVNDNRRIKVTTMGDKINEIIDYDKYGLPPIKCSKDIDKGVNNEPIKIIDSPTIYSNDEDSEKVQNFCDKIMEKYNYEVVTNDYLPKDFLIIFPIMKNNVLADELQSKIQHYWLTKETDDTIYTQYVYLHKHTEGSVINTNDSINATRILSIRSSKGDGRKVVFVLGVTERSLKLVSNNELGLVYDSHLNVALTRAKNQIYFALTKNNDDIHKRFSDNGYCEYLPIINKNVNLDKILQLIHKDNLINLMELRDITFKNTISENKNSQIRDTVDWGYHCIKRQTYYYQVILNILSDKHIFSNDKSQLLVVLRILSTYTIKHYDTHKFYGYLNEYQYKKNMPVFPLCILSNKPEYKKYIDTISNSMEIVQNKIITNKLDELSVYQSIVLTYMIKLHTSLKHSDMTHLDLYNITHFFAQNNGKELELLNNITNIKNIISSSGIRDYNDVDWNIMKHIELDSKKSEFKVSKLQFPIIGNNETDIIHIVLKSNLTQINFWDTMIEILLERFLIYNSKSDKDKSKFNDKTIHTYLFLLDDDNFIKLEWGWDKSLKNEIKECIRDSIKNHFKDNHVDIYNYFTYLRNNTDSELWENEPNKLIDTIIDKLEGNNTVKYIVDFFENLQDKITEDDDYCFVYDSGKFIKKIDSKLIRSIDKYLK